MHRLVPLIPDDLRTVAAAHPDRVALRVDGDGEMTFAQWDGWSNAVARALVTEAGLDQGDRVALLLGNAAAIRYQVAYFATQKAGGVAVPINPRYAPREVDHILANCGARVVVTTDDLRARVDGKVPLVVADETWPAWAGGDTSPFQADVAATDLADILYTSGTTGLPKGVAGTHENATTQAARPLRDGGLLLHSIPLPTFVGTHGAQTMCLRYGITNLTLPAFDPHRFAELIETERPGWVLAVPAHFLLLLESGALAGRDTSSVTVLVYGSAPTPTAAIEKLAEAFPNAMLLGGYGLTEGGSNVVTMPPGKALEKLGSVGQPMAGVTLRIIDEAGHELPAGEVGEVTLRVPSGQRSYYNDPDATAATWQDGWVHTGDLGYLDDDGFLFLVDRKKDMIVRGGYNVYSIEVESALFEHPDVVEVAVVGVPHDVLGQDICAVVRLRPGAPPLTVDDARSFLADRLADYKRPRRLVITEAPLPRSGMGKVDKKALLASVVT
jgi:acyl-CoA synthetase (AMP-forming)/AMP-acid ligase II